MSRRLSSEALRGLVSRFDAAVGLGEVEASGAVGGPSGVTSYPFHCTQIAGGSRTIDEGTAVTFTVMAGRLGRWEAAGVTPVPE